MKPFWRRMPPPFIAAQRAGRTTAVLLGALVVSNCHVAHAATVNLAAYFTGASVVHPQGLGPADDLHVPTASAARGVGIFELETTSNALSYEILFTEALLTGAELGAELRVASLMGELLLPLPLGHYKAGVTRPLAASEVASLAGNQWALTIRTTAYPLGEIGGLIGVPEPGGGILLFAGGALLAAAAVARRLEGHRINAARTEPIEAHIP